MRDHLNGLPEVVSAALFREDALIDAAAGDVVGLGQACVSEALIVAEVKVSLRSIVGDEHFSVLKRAHGARIDVQIGIELLQGDAQSTTFQQTAQ